MRRLGMFLGGFFFFSTALFALSLGGVAGCAGDGDDAGGTATSASSDDAVQAADAVSQVVVQVINASNAGGALRLSGSLVVPRPKVVISATTRDSCSGADMPDLGSGTQSMTLNGSDFSCGGATGSGSCTVTTETTEVGAATNVKGDIDCATIVIPVQGQGTDCQNVSLAGQIGFDADVSFDGTTTTFDIATIADRDLTLTLGSGRVCDLDSDVSESISVDSTTGSGTVTANGCVELCGEAFDIGGTDTL